MKLKLLTNLSRFSLLLFAFILSACAGLQTPGSGGESLVQSDPTQINRLDPQGIARGNDAYHLMVAEVAMHRGQIELAVKNYLLVAKSQNNPAIAERAVRVAVYGQDFEAATEAAQRWIELAPDRIEARQIIAAIYIRQDKVEEAYQYLDEIIENSQVADEQLFFSLLAVLAREKNTEAVLAVTRRIAEKYSDRAYAQFFHGMMAAQGEQHKEALEYLDEAMKTEDIRGAHNARSQVLLKLGRREEAVVSLRKAVDKKPNDQRLRLTYARLLVDVRYYEKARVEFKKLHQGSPEDVELIYTLGLLSLESQLLEEAEKYMLMLVEMGERQGEAQYYLGRVNEDQGRYEEAIEWFEQVHIGEYLFDARLRIANLLGEAGRFDAAHEHLQSMLKGSQSNGSLVRIYLTEGELLRAEKRYNDAMDVYSTALDIVPGNSDLLYARALAAEKVGRIDILENDLKTILETEPNNAHALNALGFTLADQTDRYEEAYDYLKRAIEIMPDDAAIIDSYGWINYRLGNYEEAIRLLRNALSRFDDGEIAAHLGEVLWVSGNQEEAKTVWKKALKKAPDDTLLQEIMERFIP
ncbi:MAG: tetratricopeptide repeat protein [Gammaproteobacteria bacterium]|nr:tetratricopeptide repeat protein [Gammaproteobacteria bacterium]